MRAWLALLMLAAAPVAQAQTPQVRAGAMAVMADDVEEDVAFAGAGDETVRGRMDGHPSDTGCRLALAVVRAGIGSGLGDGQGDCACRDAGRPESLQPVLADSGDDPGPVESGR